VPMEDVSCLWRTPMPMEDVNAYGGCQCVRNVYGIEDLKVGAGKFLADEFRAYSQLAPPTTVCARASLLRFPYFTARSAVARTEIWDKRTAVLPEPTLNNRRPFVLQNRAHASLVTSSFSRSNPCLRQRSKLAASLNMVQWKWRDRYVKDTKLKLWLKCFPTGTTDFYVCI
jgi:hypothetical protein